MKGRPNPTWPRTELRLTTAKSIEAGPQSVARFGVVDRSNFC
jgi:hypothetical protein